MFAVWCVFSIPFPPTDLYGMFQVKVQTIPTQVLKGLKGLLSTWIIHSSCWLDTKVKA